MDHLASRSPQRRFRHASSQPARLTTTVIVEKEAPLSTEKPSRPEQEAPGPRTSNEPVDGGAPADAAPSLEVPALAPVVGANGEILAVREDPAQPDAAPVQGGPGPLGPGAVAANPQPGTPATPQAGVGPSTPPPGTPATPQTGTSAPGRAAPPAQAAPGQVGPAAGAFPFGRPDEDPLPLEKPGPTVFAPDTGEADRPPVEDTAVRRRSLLAPAQPDPAETPGAGAPAPEEPGAVLPDAEPGASEPAGRAAPPGASPEANPVPAVAPEQSGPRRTRHRSGLADGDEDDVPLDGSTVIGRPRSRTGTHWAGVLVSVVALPVTWFFLHDGAAMATSRTPDSFSFDVSARGLTELAVGALALIIAMWTARRTSVGSIVVGVISILLGLPFLVAPGVMTDAFSPFLSTLSTQSALGQSLSTYLWTDAVTGKFLVLGLFMVMVGVVSYTARLDGQREQESIDRARRRAGRGD